MKVLFVSGGDYKYGAPKSMMNMIFKLKEEFGVEPILLTKRRNILNDVCDENNIENYSFWYRDFMCGSPYTTPFFTIAKHMVKYSAFLFGGLWQKHMIRNLPFDVKKIDIVHTNTNRQDIGALIASKYGKPHVWHIREFGKEDYNVIFYKDCINYMNTNASFLIAVSDAVKNSWINRGIDTNKIITVYNSFDYPAYNYKALRKNGTITKIVITGHIQPNKGQLDLVKAIAVLPEGYKEKVRVDIFGDGYGDYLKKIKKVIIDHELSDVINLRGFSTKIQSELCDYDIGVNCSKSEGLGRSTIEYMLAGLLVIASDTGANKELIENNVSGMLYHYKDYLQLSEMVVYAVDNPEQIQNMAKRAQEESHRKFTGNVNTEKIYKVYKECMETI